MKTYKVYEFENGVFCENHECANALEGIEKFIELFKKEGGKVGYKVPEDGEKFISDIIGKLLWAGGTHSPSISRLTFTPPKPEPVESEWEKLRADPHPLRPLAVIIDNIIDKITELDRRCPRKE